MTIMSKIFPAAIREPVFGPKPLCGFYRSDRAFSSAPVIESDIASIYYQQFRQGR